MKAIVYTSHAGHTAEFAALFAKRTGLPVYALAEAKTALPAGTTILYMGWLMGSKVKGYKDAAKRFSIACVCGVGMGDPGLHDDDVRTMTRIPEEIPLFTLQGGLERKKLKFGYRMLMNRIAPSTIKIINKRKEKTHNDLTILAMLMKGKNAVTEEGLIPVLEWYAEKTGALIEMPERKALPQEAPEGEAPAAQAAAEGGEEAAPASETPEDNGADE